MPGQVEPGRPGRVDQAIARLRENGNIYEKDGATWLRTSAFGDDKDRVVVKSDGKHAYIAGDLAYYLDKRARGFDLCIYMLGADHHGYIHRLKAVAAAFGDDPDTVEVLIGQLVNLLRDGEPVKMSKRAGTIITLEDLVDAVGVDAARYTLTRSSVDQVLDIDLDLISRRTNENPVFYVQYAHARLSALARNAADLGISARDAGTALRSALDGFTSNANQFRQTGRASIPIRILTTDPTQTTPADIQRLPVSGSKGVVQLGQFTTFEQARIPTSIDHVNRLRSVTIGVSAGQGHLVGDLQNGVQAATK